MLMFTLAISCLTTSNLPWFMDLAVQVPMQYCLQHWTLLPSPIMSTTGWCFFFGSVILSGVSSQSPVAYWAPTNLRSSSFSVLSFCLFILFKEKEGVDTLLHSSPTQELNPGFPRCKHILYQLSHKGSLRILEWIAFPFSREIFPTQGSNSGLLHCRQILYRLNLLRDKKDE